ncbi:hypothetical protein U1Q18_024224 [Sarracenia purpurea var. burkii]
MSENFVFLSLVPKRWRWFGFDWRFQTKHNLPTVKKGDFGAEARNPRLFLKKKGLSKIKGRFSLILLAFTKGFGLGDLFEATLIGSFLLIDHGKRKKSQRRSGWFFIEEFLGFDRRLQKRPEKLFSKSGELGFALAACCFEHKDLGFGE